MRSLEYRSDDFFKAVNRLTLHAAFADRDERGRADACWGQIVGLLARVQRLMAAGDPSSDIGRINAAPAGAAVPIDRLTAEVLERSRWLSAMTGGAFDPSVFPLVDAWGFSPQSFNAAARDAGRAPSPRAVSQLRRLVGMDGFEIGGSERLGWHCVKTRPAVVVDGAPREAMVDVGAIAKGLVADRALQIARQHGFAHAMYSTASSIALTSSGVRQGPHTDPDAFRVAVVDPRCGEGPSRDILQLYVKDRSLATSGDYGRYLLVDGTRLSHEIDGRTGYPMGYGGGGGPLAIGSLTLLGPSAMDCDALSTALCVMGARGAVDYFNDRLKGTHDLVMVLVDGNRTEAKIVTSLDARAYRIVARRAELISRRGPAGTIVLEQPLALRGDAEG